MITDRTGNVVARRDFMPFGEEIGAGVGTRSSELKYSASGLDTIRKRFTGYEKDPETGLDFAEARMYENRFGRFTAVDPLLASGKSANPQTFNRYIYVGNSPLTRSDPNGLDWYIIFGPHKATLTPKWFDDGDAPPGGRRWGTSGTVTYGRRVYSYETPFVYNVTGTNTFAALDPYTGDKTLSTTLEKANEAYRGYILRAAKEAGVGALDSISLSFWATRSQIGIQADETHDTYKIGSRFGTAFFWVTAAIGGGGGIAAGVLKIGEKGSAKLFGGLARTFAKYPACKGMCTKAAEEALSLFTKAGVEGEIVTLRNGLPYIVTAEGKTIGDTGFHQAVRVGDRYFDAVTQEAGMAAGATWEQYVKLFQGSELMKVVPK
ncbi:MAG: RHS repeat-associated core domain-containing protein [Pyrinomonadaceae bacterium]|nr:RHS repeat-associated core domain-containing protein [Pyrinomonadaceae bacterium]